MRNGNVHRGTRDWIIVRYTGNIIPLKVKFHPESVSNNLAHVKAGGFFRGLPQTVSKSNQYPPLVVSGNGKVFYPNVCHIPGAYFDSPLYAFRYTATYKLSGNAVVEQKDAKLYPVLRAIYGEKIKPRKVLKAFKAYTSMSTKGKRFTVTKSDVITVKKANLQGWAYFTWDI